jgi:hypothetical protein
VEDWFLNVALEVAFNKPGMSIMDGVGILERIEGGTSAHFVAKVLEEVNSRTRSQRFVNGSKSSLVLD